MIDRFELAFGSGKLELTRDAVGVVPGVGAHGLVVPYEVKADGIPENTLVQVRGDLRLASPSAGRWLGALIPDHDFGPTDVPRRINLTCSMSEHQWVALENVRDGGDIELQVDLHASLAGASGGYPVRQTQDRFRLGSMQWVGLLQQLGMGVGTYVFVPVPLGSSNEGVAGAADLLSKAIELQNDGRYEDAVGMARKVMEWLREFDRQTGWQKVPSRERTQEQRLAAIREALFDYSSATHHNEPLTRTFRWMRDDATLVTAAAAGLLQRAVAGSAQSGRDPKVG